MVTQHCMYTNAFLLLAILKELLNLKQLITISAEVCLLLYNWEKTCLYDQASYVYA